MAQDQNADSVRFGPENLNEEDIHLPAIVLLNAEQRQRLTETVRSNPEAQDRFQRIERRAEAALESDPQPAERIIYEGRVQSDPERFETKKRLLDMEKLWALLNAFAVSGDSAYAKKAHNFIRAWGRTTEPTGNPINMNKLAVVIAGYDMLQNDFSASEQSALAAWMRRLARQQVATSEDGKADNWQAKRLKLIGLIGFALDDQQLIDTAIRGFKAYVAEGLRPDGRSLDLEQRDALEYHVGALKPLLELAIAAQSRGRHDLYEYQTPSGASLQQSVRFVVPYAQGEKVHREWQDSEVAFDRERYESGDEHYKPGRVWNPKSSVEMFELALALETDDHRTLLLSIVQRLSNAEPTVQRFPTWMTVLAAALR